MARLFTSSFGLSSLTDGVEFTTAPTGGSISTTTTRPNSDGYSWRCNAGAYFARQNISPTDLSTIGYIGVAIYIASAVNASTQLVRWSAIGNISVGNITLKTDNTLVLLDSAGNQIGSASSALSTNTWYYVELKNDATALTGVLTARLNGTVFATGNNSNRGSFARALVGCITGAQTTNDIYFDDWKINDNSGSSQTGYPGDSNVLITRPNGNGETTQWTIGGSSPAATNWQGVNEVPPNDATTFNSAVIAAKEDLYTVTSLGLTAYDTINLVQVGCRFNNPTADATTSFKIEIEKASGGTKLQSSSITPNSALWRTNSITIPDTYALTAYVDPDGNPWTYTTLDSMRIGVIMGTIGTFAVQVTNMWAYVDYTVGSAPGPSSPGFFSIM